jgi:hypothetical protein
LVTAVSELAAHTLRHTPGAGTVCGGRSGAELLCQIDDAGQITDPLAGYRHVPAGDLLSQARTAPAMSEYTALWKGGLGENAPAWLAQHGWQPQLYELSAVAASYGRDIPGTASGGFLTADRVSEGPARATDVPHVRRSSGQRR